MISQNLQQYAGQLQQQASAAAAAAAVAAAAAAARPLPRPAMPASYKGSAAGLDSWLAKLEQLFSWQRYGASDDAHKIQLAVMCLDGPALDWWSTLSTKPAAWDDANQTSFVQALRARFQPITSADAARAKLYALQQGRLPVQDYISSFRSLLPKVPDMGEADRLFQFLRGLQPQISAQLRMQNVLTVEAAVQMAARIGSFKELQGAGSSSAAASSDAMDLSAMLEGVEGLEAETGDAPVTRSELQMLLAALQESRRAKGGAGGAAGGNRRALSFQRGGLPRIEHLSQEQVKEYMDAGKCFGCGSTEHRSRQCPKRKVGADGRVSWSN